MKRTKAGRCNSPPPSNNATTRACPFLTRLIEKRKETYNLMDVPFSVAGKFDIDPARIFEAGKYPRIVQARSLFCYWAVRELGLTATSLAKKLQLSQPAVSMAMKRGEKIARENEYVLPAR
jgi:hypothetical protein